MGQVVTLFCGRCNGTRVWTKVQVGHWHHDPATWTIERMVGGMWTLSFTPAIECPTCGTRRDPKTLHLVSPRKDYYDLPKV